MSDISKLIKQMDENEVISEIRRKRIVELMIECADYMKKNAELLDALRRALLHLRYNNAPGFERADGVDNHAEHLALIADIERLIGDTEGGEE